MHKGKRKAWSENGYRFKMFSLKTGLENDIFWPKSAQQTETQNSQQYPLDLKVSRHKYIVGTST